MRLYAPVFEKSAFSTQSAYTSSPVKIEMSKPDSLLEMDRVDFAYNKSRSTVTMDGKEYSLNTWIKMPFGEMRFIPNSGKTSEPLGSLYFTLIDPKKVVDNLHINLKVAPSSKLSSVINLSMNDQVPQRAKDILNLLIQDYNDVGNREKNKITAKTLSFIEGRIRYVVMELDSVERELTSFRTQNGVFDLSEQGKVYLQNVGSNDNKLTDINMQLSMLDEVERYISSRKDNIDVGLVPAVPAISGGERDFLLTGLLQKLYDSQIQYERLKRTLPEDNSQMIALRTDIERMRPAILENIQNQRRNLIASRANLSSSTGQFSSLLQGIPRKERQLIDITRQQTIKNDAYSFLLQKREETALAYASTVDDSRTIEHAVASIEPVSPKKMLVYLTALAMALMLGFVYINFKEKLTNKVLFRSDIEQLTSIPVLTEIVKVRGKNPLVTKSKSIPFVEQFRQLRSLLIMKHRQAGHNKIMVTSTVATEGKSFVSTNLALSIASSGKRVALVDFDLRNPKTSSFYNLQNEPGIADYLEKNNEMNLDKLIYETDNKKLFVVPAGNSDINPTELLLNGNLNGLFESLTERFDFIIVDTCPTDPVIDAFILAEHCNATLFIIRHGFTKKPMIQQLDESYKMNAFKDISIVFNGIKPRGFIRKKYGVGFGYGTREVYGKEAYGGKKSHA
jgi:capsular exopolysaccharide synthesis family protein